MRRKNKQQGLGLVRLLTLFWLILGAALCAISILWTIVGNGNLLEGNRPLLLTSGIAALAMGFLLIQRPAWARLAAVIYQVALGGAILIILVFEQINLRNWAADNLPNLFTPNSWAAVLTLITMAIALMLLASTTSLLRAESAFHQAPLRRLQNICPTCSRSLEHNQICTYCDLPTSYFAYLQPALPNHPPIMLPFEVGVETIGIGRDVDLREGYVYVPPGDVDYLKISRQHAKVSCNLDSKEIILHRDDGEILRVEDQDVSVRQKIKLGNKVQLAHIEFALGSHNFETQLAYWGAVNDVNDRELLIFDPNHVYHSMGRLETCSIALPSLDISRHHISIGYDPEYGFILYNKTTEANPNHVEVSGVDVGPDTMTPLPMDQLSVITLANRHRYWFEPIPYAN